VTTEKAEINPPVRKIDLLFEVLSGLGIVYMVTHLIYKYPGLTEFQLISAQMAARMIGGAKLTY